MAAMEITRCGIHGFHEVLGIDTDQIRFYWALHADAAEAAQTAYRIVVALDAALLDHPDAAGAAPAASRLVWDSGRVASDQQRNIACEPDDGFASASFHYWRVTVWDQDGRAVAGPVQEFFTAYPRSSRLLPPYSMNQTYMPHSSLIFRTWFEDAANRWKGVWIGDGGDKPLYLRRELQLARTPTRAVAFVSGLGHCNFVCNGDDRAANGHVLDPGWTNYHRTVQFVAYDLSGLLRAGANVVGAHVGNGFYAGDGGGADRFFWPAYEDNTYVRYGNELCFMAELHLFYADGTRETRTTGPEWRVRRSATTLANVYSSETTDLGAYPHGWDAPGFREAADAAGAWAPATPVTGPRGRLRYQSQPPVVLHETLAPVARRTLQPGTVAFDLGQNASVMVRLEVSGPAGAEVVVRFSETVDDAGRVFMPDPLFKQFEQGVYCHLTLAGRGVETWQPDFCFTSARYVQVEGVALAGEGEGAGDPALPVIHSLVGQHVSSAARRLGSLTTDRDDVNALIRMCHWSFSSNLFSYHTDCPQIEKFAWLEVAHLLAPATQYVRDAEALYAKMLDDMVDAQEPSGLVPTMAPEMRYMAGPLHDTITWGGAAVLLPALLRFYYGSTAVTARLFGPGLRYMEYMATRERAGGLIEHGLGDWGRAVAFGNLQANIETAVYHQCLCNLADMARELGRPDEARLRAWAARVHAAYNRHLLVADRRRHPYAFYTSRDVPGQQDRTMVAQAVALQFGLVPPALVADVRTAFVDACEAAGRRIEAGEIGLKYVWETLADVDRPDIVLAMARQEEHPSYMRFVRRGETTLSEFWQDACRSKCHDMLGTIYEWFYAAVLGLKPETDAYRTFTVKPPLRSEFAHVQGSVDCPYGDIRIEYNATTGADGQRGAAMRLRVPMSTTAFLLLPDESSAVDVVREGSEGAVVTKTGRRIPLRHGTYKLKIRP